ncbi:ring-cleaving dioxygenase [Bacillus sp. AFS076308]|uniref:ring-cleaving dioxygenase n=1 Tax=unclassified Bacillus (in: firmicutes) TaxID=185979 RepID=UPI000BF8AAAC|nr:MULTISPECIES: ring-cleaving dioxygenase [unclassified Bacillus (in: firmicutes)]PFO08513.1 ring-cleaving dioxygenase [Bacillus sp. AFS076308]PGV54674.1 ring-cleaving dioxygenase [Bacillus sp. AFS037270]
MQLLGLHHVSILTGKAERNYEFYTKILGMRLVKKTVNQDNTESYHLFYADAEGTPGTEVTFFDIPGLGHSYRGTSDISTVSLKVKTTDALLFWKERFTQLGIHHDSIEKRAGRDTLAFRDFEGTRLILVADNEETGVRAGIPWKRDDIPVEHAIIGLGPVTLTVSIAEPTIGILTEVMGFRFVSSYPSLEGEYPNIMVFATGEGGSGAEVHIETRPDLPRARIGRGGVHHVAFRVPNEEEYHLWAQRLKEHRIANSGKVERYYFKALYFREPNGILFELSTDTPGFATDEPLETMGQKLALPPFLEPRREEIEANLRPLELN